MTNNPEQLQKQGIQPATEANSGAVPGYATCELSKRKSNDDDSPKINATGADFIALRNAKDDLKYIHSKLCE